MSAQIKQRWPVAAAEPPRLSNSGWYASGLVGVILVVAIVLQIIDFQAFSDNLGSMGLGSSNWWAGAVVFAEVIGAAGFFKIRLSSAFRLLSNFLAALVAGFWFYESVYQVSAGNSTSANFFGRFLHQTPGWWSVIEATAFLFLVMYVLEVSTGKSVGAATRVTRRKK